MYIKKHMVLDASTFGIRNYTLNAAYVDKTKITFESINVKAMTWCRVVFHQKNGRVYKTVAKLIKK